VNALDRYLEKLAQQVIENPTVDDPEQQFVIPQQQDEEFQIPQLINLSEQMVKRQNPNGAWFNMDSNEGANVSGTNSEYDLYTGPSDPDNGMAME
jgi:hypothetical protein